MALDKYKLTKNPQALCDLINTHVDREESRLQYRYTTWALAWYYLNGARRFDLFDPTSGMVQPHYLDENGNMEYQSQELLSAIDRVSGIINSMDVRPKINRTGSALTHIRDRAVGQVIADAITKQDHLDDVLSQFAHIFVTLGSCGIAGHITDHPTVGLTTDYEVVHPRELYPFPSLGHDYTKQRGLIRERVVPLSFLEEIFGRRVRTNLEKMYYFEVEAGEEVDPYDGDDAPGASFGVKYNTSKLGYGGDNKKETTQKLVRIRELWLYGTHDMVDRYVVTSGDYVLDDKEFDGLEVYCPIGFARFMETGTFHGNGLFDLLFSVNREMEKLLKSLFNNIRDMDQYGILVMPQGQFNERAALRDVGRGLRVLPYEPDAVDPGFRPFNIAPFSSGEIPGKTAAYAKQLMDQINPFRDLAASKGRIDSAAGLGFLDEKNKQLMTNAARSCERAWAQAHRAALSGASRTIAKSRRAIPVNKLTLDLAGAIIDPSTGAVSFEQNPIPVISDLGITIRETNPRSEIARKQEALQLYNMPGMQDPTRFMLLALEEGLDFALYMGEEQAAYETVVRNILMLYGDGEQPGKIILTPHTAIPKLQGRVLTAFMSSPMMGMSSPTVQDEFKKYREFMMMSMGTVLPEGVPSPEEGPMGPPQPQQGQMIQV